MSNKKIKNSLSLLSEDDKFRFENHPKISYELVFIYIHFYNGSHRYMDGSGGIHLTNENSKVVVLSN